MKEKNPEIKSAFFLVIKFIIERDCDKVEIRGYKSVNYSIILNVTYKICFKN